MYLVSFSLVSKLFSVYFTQSIASRKTACNVETRAAVHSMLHNHDRVLFFTSLSSSILCLQLYPTHAVRHQYYRHRISNARAIKRAAAVAGELRHNFGEVFTSFKGLRLLRLLDAFRHQPCRVGVYSQAECALSKIDWERVLFLKHHPHFFAQSTSPFPLYHSLRHEHFAHDGVPAITRACDSVCADMSTATADGPN